MDLRHQRRRPPAGSVNATASRRASGLPSWWIWSRAECSRASGRRPSLSGFTRRTRCTSTSVCSAASSAHWMLWCLCSARPGNENGRGCRADLTSVGCWPVLRPQRQPELIAEQGVLGPPGGVRLAVLQGLPHAFTSGFEEHLPGALAADAGQEADQELVAGERAVTCGRACRRG